MSRALLLSLGIVLVTYVGFTVFPGHTYLHSDTQVYVPMLERLDSPGYLSRDLVATHPHLTFTIFDEVTLFLHDVAGLTFRSALIGQQLLFRAAAVLGVFLLMRGIGFSDLFAFLLATLLNLGAALRGPGVALVDLEPLPRAFAFGLILLAMGLLAREKPLLAGLAGGLALLYDPPTAAPFWIVVLIALLFDHQLRPLLRASGTVLLVFVLLLANLAQLQPAVLDSQVFFAKLPSRVADLQRYHGSGAWVSLWAARDLLSYLFICVCGYWATARIWPVLNRQTRWLFAALPLLGIVSVPASYLLLERLRWSLIPQIHPSQALLFAVTLAFLACGAAGVRAALHRRTRESCLWFVVPFALPANATVFELLRVTNGINLRQLILCGACAILLARFLAHYGTTRWKPVVLLVPVLAALELARFDGSDRNVAADERNISEVAEWAYVSTWGGSMFSFPDAGRSLYPGIFRAQSTRAVWVDWTSGILMDYYESFANDWWERWHQTMQPSFSKDRLENMPPSIDYYVLQRINQLSGVAPVFANREFVVYSARDLHKLPIRSGTERSSRD